MDRQRPPEGLGFRCTVTAAWQHEGGNAAAQCSDEQEADKAGVMKPALRIWENKTRGCGSDNFLSFFGCSGLERGRLSK